MTMLKGLPLRLLTRSDDLIDPFFHPTTAHRFASPLYVDQRWLSTGGGALRIQNCCNTGALSLSFPWLPTTKHQLHCSSRGYGKEVPLRTIHVYRAARHYFVDGIY